jgi:hypothetical protein
VSENPLHGLCAEAAAPVVEQDWSGAGDCRRGVSG